MKKESVEALNTINQIQTALWNISHSFRGKAENTADILWQFSLQIEQALKVINREEFGRDEYWDDDN